MLRSPLPPAHGCPLHTTTHCRATATLASYINTNHKDFDGGAGAMAKLLSRSERASHGHNYPTPDVHPDNAPTPTYPDNSFNSANVYVPNTQKHTAATQKAKTPNAPKHPA